jgi:hypothetical protein
MASSWYGLNAQDLLETELKYDFSGQIDTFSVDHNSGIEAVIGRIWDYFTTQLSTMKTQIRRTHQKVGTRATRLP